jgi:hypothetical protein
MFEDRPENYKRHQYIPEQQSGLDQVVRDAWGKGLPQAHHATVKPVGKHGKFIEPHDHVYTKLKGLLECPPIYNDE